MLAIAAFLAVGTALELAVEGHYESPVQAVPFVLAGLTIVLAGLGMASPNAHVRGRRIGMGLVLLGATFGVWEHLEHNAIFEQEIRPTADAFTVWSEAFFGGNPVLAPGLMLAMGLLLGASTSGLRVR